MRAYSTIWTASLALASLCGPLLITAEAAPAPQTASPERPKYYFPRHVKRQFTNSSTPAIETPTETPTSKSKDGNDLGDIFSSLQSEGIEVFPPSTTLPKGTAPSSSASSSEDDPDGIPTIVVSDPVRPPPIPVSPSETTSSEPPESPSSSVSTDDTKDPTQNPGDIFSLLSSLLGGDPDPTSTDSSDTVASTGTIPPTVLQPTTTSQDDYPSTTQESTSETGIIVGITTAIGTSTEPTPTTTSDDLGLGGILSSILDPLDPEPTTTAATTTSDESSSIVTSTAVETPPPTSTDIGGVISSLLSSIFDPPTPTTSEPISESQLPTSTLITDGSQPPTGTATFTIPPTSATLDPTNTGGANNTQTTPPPVSTGYTTGNGTSPTTVVTDSQATISAESTATTPGHSIIPITTNTLTSEVVPSSVQVEPSTVTPHPTSASGLPSDIPRVIQPPGGMPAAPANMTLVQFGFLFGLNYLFVVKTKDSANQIFQFLPRGVSDGLGIPGDQVTMYALRPYDTTATLGYITTLALVYIPTDMFDQLNLDLHTPVSALYNNPDPSVNTLMSLINPSIPLLAGWLPADGGKPASSPGNNAAPTNGPGGDGPMGGGATTKSPVVMSSVGIAFAATGGVLAYGAAMFFVARRYRKRRQGHHRSSSVATTSRGSRGSYGAVWMSGGRGPGRYSPAGRNSQGSSSSQGRSVRTAQISAPVMAENSLGWN